MRKKLIISLLAAVVVFGVSITANAVSFTMTGAFVKTAVSDNGTLGTGGSTSPGILHDPTGTGTFGVDDYLTPGVPHEIFSLASTETGLLTNNNTGTVGMAKISITDLSGGTFDNHVNWLGGTSLVTVEHDTFFNDGDERINLRTTITALGNLTNLRYLRSLDPDPDVVTFGSFDTVNGRGATGLAPEDWVHSEGLSTGLTIGLFSNSAITHNTGVSSGWAIDPAFYLAGTNDGNGDYTIGLAFDIGSLTAGSSVTFDYAYVMGDSLGTVDIPGAVPEPTTIALLGIGLAGFVGTAIRRRLKKAKQL